MVDQVLPPKLDVALKLLEDSSLFIHLDPRRDGVSVPAWFKKQAQLVLQVGLAMAVPIHDLEVAEKGISCTLSFSRQPHWCFMPWSAIFALVGDDGRGMVWPEDVPSEVARQSDLRGPAPKPATRKRAPAVASLDDVEAAERLDEAPKPSGPPRLSLLPGGASAPAPDAAAPEMLPVPSPFPAIALAPPPPESAPASPASPAAPAAPERQLVLFESTGAKALDDELGGNAAPLDLGDPANPASPRRERPAWLRVVKGGVDEA